MLPAKNEENDSYATLSSGNASGSVLCAQRLVRMHSNCARNREKFYNVLSQHRIVSFIILSRFPSHESEEEKMTVIDILFRVDTICQKYDKYDIDKQRELNAFGDDAFARFYAVVEKSIQAAHDKSQMASQETNRAAAVAMNAEVRRTKGRLMDEIPKLRKLAQKKVKGLTKEEMAIRNDLVLALPESIQAIPDGIATAAIQTGGTATTSHQNIKFDSSEGHLEDQYFHQSEESSQYRQEYEMRKMKQDEGLDIISDGLDTLKNLALDMNEELDRQVPLMDEIETKVDKTTSDLRNNNVRLKKTLNQVRSSRNFCIDIILLCVLLGIISYIYNALR